MMRLFVSGPMRGLPDKNRGAFYEAELLLKVAGYRVHNPARCELMGATFVTGMRHHLAALLECDGIAMLPGWEDSEGACIEVGLAGDLLMPAYPYDTWLTLEPREGDFDA